MCDSLGRARRDSDRGIFTKEAWKCQARHLEAGARRRYRAQQKRPCIKVKSADLCHTLPNCTWKKHGTAKEESCGSKSGVLQGAVYQGPVGPSAAYRKHMQQQASKKAKESSDQPALRRKDQKLQQIGAEPSAAQVRWAAQVLSQQVDPSDKKKLQQLVRKLEGGGHKRRARRRSRRRRSRRRRPRRPPAGGCTIL